MKFNNKPVLWLLVVKKGACNYWPFRNAGKGCEVIRLVEFTGNGHCILKDLDAMRDGGWMTFS